MTYDQWKTTDPDPDEHGGPRGLGPCPRCGAESVTPQGDCLRGCGYEEQGEPCCEAHAHAQDLDAAAVCACGCTPDCERDAAWATHRGRP